MSHPKIAELFLIEADELVTALEQGLVELEDHPRDSDRINDIFRAAHTIKGSAGLAGYGTIVEITHVMENLLEEVRSQRLLPSSELVTVLLQGVDVVKALLARLAQGKRLLEVEGFAEAKRALSVFLEQHEPSRAAPLTLSIPVGTLSQTQVSLHPSLRPSLAPAPLSARSRALVPSTERRWEIRFRLGAGVMETGLDPSFLVLELGDLGTLEQVEVDVSELPSFEALDPLRLYLGWKVLLRSAAERSSIENVFVFVADEATLSIEDVTHRYRDGVDITKADKRLGELLVEEGVVRSADVQAVLASQRPVGELLVQAGKVEPEKLGKVLAEQHAARDVRARTSIRVDLEKLDGLMNLIGELVTSSSRLDVLANAMGAGVAGASLQVQELRAAVDGLGQVSRDLQEQVMRVRMVPLQPTFDGFRRVVRDLAGELGKHVELVVSGGETEVDKNIIDRISDPLKHLIRNCMDHGLESPEERRAAGKPAQGRVELAAFQQGGDIHIWVTDDGRGVDKDAVLAKAREKNLVAPDATLSETEILALLFAPGFSTAKSVTEISGRGVGMDVVRKNIDELRGTVEIETVRGVGTRFKIRLPLTLAIIDAMSVAVGQEVLAVPLLSIVEQIRPRPADIIRVEGRGELINVRGDCLPLARLHQIFGLHTECTDPTRGLVVVLEAYGKRFGLLVDNVLGQTQAVIKSIETNFRRVDGIAGATILGDGRVSLVLDPHRIQQLAFN
jgi:two-component system chemotaxis sensor kinase CheA